MNVNDTYTLDQQWADAALFSKTWSNMGANKRMRVELFNVAFAYAMEDEAHNGRHYS